VFGPHAIPHEHDWRVVIHVAGPIDPATGWCCDLPQLDAAVDRILEGWDGGDLNAAIADVAAGAFRPSTENLARWIFLGLRRLVDEPAALVQVEVHESDELGAVFPPYSGWVVQQAGFEKTTQGLPDAGIVPPGQGRPER